MTRRRQDVSKRDLPDVQWYILTLLAQAQDLRLIGRDRIVISPLALTENLQYGSQDYVAKACKELERMGLLERHPDHVLYSITDDGLAYVNGEKSLEEIVGDEGEHS